MGVATVARGGRRYIRLEFNEKTRYECLTDLVSNESGGKVASPSCGATSERKNLETRWWTWWHSGESYSQKIRMAQQDTVSEGFPRGEQKFAAEVRSVICRSELSGGNIRNRWM